MENKTAEQILLEQLNGDLRNIEYGINTQTIIHLMESFALQQTQVLSDIIVIKDDTIERMKTELTQAKEANGKLVELAKDLIEWEETNHIESDLLARLNLLSNTKEPSKDE